ncbi:MAG: tRNA uridine-5-carboxymethylaminomethyl(34) synthesis GTPase MnmE [Henriciella sp.]|nr:tRNA uridine-5-carboxymethylaminomethyl(34) synthesis GTPase MnmE [Henriciella sp.]
MDPTRDTICALASGPPPSAICIIRVSGPRVRPIATSLLSAGLPEPRISVLTNVSDASGQTIDQGLAVFMPGPASYTGEDTLELSLHGGQIIVDLALAALYEAGARLAEPGEFTRRAFQAGKLDLTKAEAIADLIDATSVAQHRQATLQYDGALADLYGDWRQRLTECHALLEAGIDFPDEEDAPTQVGQPVLVILEQLITNLDAAMDSGNITERIRDGFQIAILGKPNAGKSTLLNRIAGRDAAIVTDIPGTTRDVVEVRLILGGYLVWLSDTAGLRETLDVVEAEGVRRAHAKADEADLRLWLVAPGDTAPAEAGSGPQDILVHSKSDLREADDVSRETFQISAATGAGVDALISEITRRLKSIGAQAEAPMITRARHRQAITSARQEFSQATSMLQSGYGLELVSEHVRQGSKLLASLTGHVEVEDVLGEVFSSFCIGK